MCLCHPVWQLDLKGCEIFQFCYLPIVSLLGYKFYFWCTIYYLTVCPDAATDEAVMNKVQQDFIKAVDSMKQVFDRSQV